MIDICRLYRLQWSTQVASKALAGACLAVAVALLVLPNSAQEQTQAKPKTPYAALGAPSNPRVATRWNRYHDHEEATALLKKLTEKFPKLCQLQSAGKSFGGRDMWILTIADPSGTTPIDAAPRLLD